MADPIKSQRELTVALKAFFWEIDLWVTSGDFRVKNAKLLRESVFNQKLIT